MLTKADKLKTFIENELAKISDTRVINHVRKLLVEPNAVLRDWDYGEPDQQYICWTVFAHASSGTGIAYCENGFGPRLPWGLVNLGGDAESQSMGMDSGWFSTFITAYFDSFASTELPIWRVFMLRPDKTRVALTSESTWKATWEQIADLQNSNPSTRYICGHSIAYEDDD